MVIQAINSQMASHEFCQTQKEIIQVLVKHTDDLQMAKLILERLDIDGFSQLKPIE